jgi:hypothetical protein
MVQLHDSHAWYDLMPGHPPMLHVSASCTGLSAGQSGELRRSTAAPGAPSIVGPPALARSSPPPTFSVDPGQNPFYSVEVATRPELLDPAAPRTDAEFHGTWQVNTFLSAPTYTLDAAVWERLKGADRLYYQIVTSASEQGFVDPVPSTAASEVASAPFIAISDAPAPSGGTATLSLQLVVHGPAGVETADAVPVRYREEKGDIKYDKVIIQPLGLEIPVEDVF